MVSPKKLLKKNPFVLAPMDDVTDIGFRELVEQQGHCSYSVTELTSVDALVRDKVYSSRYERGNLTSNSVQLFGSKAELFVESAKKIGDEADMIDVNFGCPSATVNANDAGAMLLKDPKHVGEIISSLVKHIDKPITAKMRLGYQKTSFLEVAKEIEDAGAEVLAVHGRTAKQKYTGQANWESIQEIYQQAKIPIIGNGDIKDETQIDEYLGTHADALMIGRAAIGNPFIFERFTHYHNTKEKLELRDEQRKEKQKELFSLYLKNLQGREFRNVFVKIQRQAMWFFKGIEGTKKLREQLVQEKTIEGVLARVKEF